MSYVSSLVLRLSAIVSVAFLSACGGSKIEPTPTPVPDPPAISCPAFEAQTSPTGQAIPLTFAPTVTAGEAPVTTVCTPASGSSFELGTTTVSCTATDARQRTASCTFDVQVQPPPRIAVTRFAAFGDSLTEGEDGSNTLVDPADVFGLQYPRVLLFGREYPTVLQLKLAARYTTQSIRVDNHGCRGEYARGLSPCYGAGTLARFRATIGTGAYDSVLLMEGTNDIWGGSGGNPLGIPPAIANLRIMVQDARGRGLRVFLATIPPANPATLRGGERYQAIPLLNNEIRQLAATIGVPLVDVFAAFNNDFSLLGADGTHPNTQGYELIASTFFDVLRSQLEAPSSLVLPGLRQTTTRFGR